MADEPAGLPWMLSLVPADGRQANLYQVLRLTPGFEASVEGELLPVFASEDLAEAFADTFGRRIGLALEPFRPTTNSDALDALQGQHLHGVSHVCLDPSATDRRCTRLVPIAEFYDRYRDRNA